MNIENVHSPSVAVVFLQPACNMSCTFCVTEDDFEPMGREDATQLLGQLADLGVRSVVFGGGEPFTWPGDVVWLARRAAELGLVVQVGTNGVSLPDGYADLECIDRWVLPVESVHASVHDAMRHHRLGHHALILGRLEDLRRTGRSVTVSTVLTSVNVPGLEDLAEYLMEYHSVRENIHAWHLYQFLPLGRGGRKNEAALSIPAEAYLEACDRVQGRNLPFRVFRRRDMYRSRTVEFYWSQGGRVVSGSSALHDKSPLGPRA